MEEGMERLIGGLDDYQWGDSKTNNNIPNNQLNNFLEKVSKESTAEAVKKYMPIGSVVKLYNDERNLMIIGYRNSQNGVKFDYIGCVFPQGINSENKMNLFNHTQIERIYHLGLINDAQKECRNNLLSQDDNQTLPPIQK